jgi:asparagine synthase (glutamine-hydrolysing)
MCGIAGFITFSNSSSSGQLMKQLSRMTHAIKHRGPDDSGFWISDNKQVALGHRRLSILDLSEQGRQPMISHSKNLVMIFNGELYNYHEVRKQLDLQFNSISWKGNSDSEVFLEAIDRWGIREALDKSNGMFGLALYNRSSNRLYLIRDRLGEKPLYYGTQGGLFIFSSELSALQAHKEFNPEIDREALCLYLRHLYVPGPLSIYKGIYKLQAGCLLELDLNKGLPFQEKIECYWSASERYHALTNSSAKESSPLPELKEQLLGLIQDSTRLRLHSDVPLGAFLSGGIDSSLVVAIAQSILDKPLNTFSIGFEDSDYNEAHHAASVASYLGTNHTELYISPKTAQSVIHELGTLFSEPFADASQIPTYLLSKMTREHVKVSLSGDGGDELFGGYTRYLWADSIWKNLNHIPLSIRGVIANSIDFLFDNRLKPLSRIANQLIPNKYQQAHLSKKLQKLASVLTSRNFDEFHHGLLSYWKNPQQIVLGANQSFDIVKRTKDSGPFRSALDQMTLCDIQSYLCDDILPKVDRCTMATGLEGRIPLLDHRIVEFSLSLPIHAKIQNKSGKVLLRQILYDMVPQGLIDRPKAGFEIPLAEWLKHELKPWASDLLDPHRLRSEGFFQVELIQKKWTEHLEGSHDWHLDLWAILMFETWLDTNFKP